jgi:hypothetical protein
MRTFRLRVVRFLAPWLADVHQGHVLLRCRGCGVSLQIRRFSVLEVMSDKRGLLHVLKYR